MEAQAAPELPLRRRAGLRDGRSDSPESIDLGFSVADAEHPSLSLDGQTPASFTDWRQEHVALVFEDVISVRWQEADYYFGPEDRNDGCTLIRNSVWLSEHVRSLTTFGDRPFRHLKLNFNAAGILEVRCTEIRQQQNGPERSGARTAVMGRSQMLMVAGTSSSASRFVTVD